MARVEMMVRLLLSIFFWGLPALVFSQTPMPTPTLSSTDAIRLALASGMQLQDGKLVNRCGRASNPKISFLDLNGDGTAEALVADVDPDCYRAPGAWFAIVSRNDRGRWVQLIGEDGVVGFAADRTPGLGESGPRPGGFRLSGHAQVQWPDLSGPAGVPRDRTTDCCHHAVSPG